VKVLDFATKNNTIKLDHIVDTAGAPPFALDLNTVQPSQIDAVVKSRVIPKMILSKLARTYVKDSYTSSITFTSGALVTKPTPGFGVHASIGGGDGLARGMAKDLAPIRANVVAPGAIRTPLLERFAGSGDFQAMLDRFASATLLKRVGQPEDVAESYLAAMKNHYQTGTVTHVEGGYYLV
jgi:NAD(P)-dependent dehydrogenase (short-subunit alcohol dehydrogenase family)